MVDLRGGVDFFYRAYKAYRPYMAYIAYTTRKDNQFPQKLQARRLHHAVDGLSVDYLEFMTLDEIRWRGSLRES